MLSGHIDPVQLRTRRKNCNTHLRLRNVSAKLIRLRITILIEKFHRSDARARQTTREEVVKLLVDHKNVRPRVCIFVLTSLLVLYDNRRH